ncbi:hypothetical protein C8R43DRAFT_875920 [Mycena crocata]|nr:hypothetical protein C8R43DRAFT_875920 [Mycena crocata]
MPSTTTFTSVSAATKPHVRFTEAKKKAPLGPEERKVKNETRQTNQAAVDAAISKWFTETVALAEELSLKHKHKAKYYLEMMFQGGAHMINQQGKPNAYNAFKAVKAAECRERGESKKAPQLHRDYHEEYEALDDEGKQGYIQHFQEEEGEREVKLRRDTPRGKLQDVLNVAKNMKQLMNGAKMRAGIEGFFCIVRDSPDFYMQPQWYFTSSELEGYMPIATRKKWVTTEVGTRIEAFAVAGCDVLGACQCPTSLARL